jgi:thioredoxin-like negative regulator of GroEL
MKRAIVIALDAALGALLVSGCAVQPSSTQPQVKPVLEVRHSGLQPDGYYQLGRFLQTQGRYEDAGEAYRKALALDPKNADAHNGMGSLHALHGRYAEAHAEFAAALAQSPDNAAVLNNIGYTLLLERKAQEAVAPLQKAAQLEPENARYRANLEVANQHQSPGPAEALAAAAPATFDAVSAHPQSAGSSVTRTAGEADPVRLVPIGPNAFELVVPPRRASAPVLASLPVTPSARPVFEVSNGNGATGMARRVGLQLATAGVKVARLTNQIPYGEVTTQVFYRPGHEKAAVELAWRIPGHPPVAASIGLRSGIEVRLVLGRELPVDVALVPPAQRVAHYEAASPD